MEDDIDPAVVVDVVTNAIIARCLEILIRNIYLERVELIVSYIKEQERLCGFQFGRVVAVNLIFVKGA